MGRIIMITVRLIRAGSRAYAKKWSFLGFFAFAFLGSVAMLGSLDLLPESSPAKVEAARAPSVSLNSRPTEKSAPEAARPSKTSVAEAKTDTGTGLPVRIEIPSIGLSALVVNPSATSVAALDQGLLSGAVRYPTSAKLGEAGTVVLFGHSSYLPVVRNQAFKTFNGIQKLTEGDVVTVYSATDAYSYRVRSVAKESARDNAAIPLFVVGKTLTLVTCNSFGAKEDRFVVTADFVESRAISG